MHSQPDDRAGLEIDRMLGFVRQIVRPSFIFVIFVSGSCGCVPWSWRRHSTLGQISPAEFERRVNAP